MIFSVPLQAPVQEQLLEEQNTCDVPVQDTQMAADERVVSDLYEWLQLQAELSSLTSNMPIAYMYADGIHNIDTSTVLAHLAARWRKAGGHAAVLQPRHLNAKQGLSKLAQELWNQTSSKTAAPISCTLRCIAEQLAPAADAQKESGVLSSSLHRADVCIRCPQEVMTAMHTACGGYERGCAQLKLHHMLVCCVACTSRQ
jgi:hypothetical protein